ncbi:hypothetical protein AUC43_13620 [Hymenobacter sedentarius]|uniref:TonB-dependent receptor plug domain-containing protein n=1 Tax=Hymenobacter sedentarius TaxID=1411621 RepID=A0A0U3SIU9_9BACT|nr:carboxypeptidase-like regulatory domain-containing protein [Hymenobacter sedentarius]ALW86036.1 hypothetical protein AUC43_13620 [Hymenobacter sedentarius]
MNPEDLPKLEEEQYDPNLDAQDEEVMSGGNNRLMYVLVAVILALVVGYIALPKGGKGGGTGLAAATPSFMLEDAAVTATARTSSDSIAAGLKATPAAKVEEADEEVAKPAAKTAAPKPAVATAPAAAPAAVAAAPEPAPVAEAAPAPVATPEPAAPANVTMSGRIVDENGRPLVGATVLLKGSSKGTSTDANGNYSMEVPGGDDHSLIFGYGGYDDEVVRTSGSKSMNVTLTPRAKAGKKRR